MKLIQISAPHSNSGKTITSAIIARSLKNMGLDVAGFKCGPDYIDSKYQAFATKKENGNLDIHLMGKTGLFHSLSLNKADYGVVEGAMGYFDGIGIGYESSAFDIAEKLDINTILVYRPKGEMFSIIPKVKGMVDFSKGRIKGIIFSATNKVMYEMLKKMVEENLDIKVLGYTEKSQNLDLSSRELGLMMPDELDQFDKILDEESQKSLETINYEEIISLMKEVKVDDSLNKVKKSKYTIAIAKDKAFCFYYGENIKLFEKYFNVKYFSPMKDEKLPEADLVYMVGGYPELHIDSLSANKSMLKSVRDYIEAGKYFFGEGAGLVYLTKSLLEKDLVGIFDAKTVMNKRLQNFGYVYLTLKEDSILGNKGERIPAHEFHYSSLYGELEPTIEVEKASKTKAWTSGYKYKNALCIYQHINFSGNERILENIIKKLGG